MPYYSGAVATERSSYVSYKMPVTGRYSTAGAGTASSYGRTSSASDAAAAAATSSYFGSAGTGTATTSGYTRSTIPRSYSIDTKQTYSSGSSSVQSRSSSSSLTSSRQSSLSEDSGISSRGSFSSTSGRDRSSDSRESSVTGLVGRSTSGLSARSRFGASDTAAGAAARRQYASSLLDADFLSKYSPSNYVPNCGDSGRPPAASAASATLRSAGGAASALDTSTTSSVRAARNGGDDYVLGSSYGRSAGLAVGGCSAAAERRSRNKSVAGDEDNDSGVGVSASTTSAHSRSRERPQSTVAAASLGLVGIRNLGNTCFMNSVVQCLSNTKPLKQYLLENGHLAEINTTNSEMKGSLIKAFATVIQELWDPNTTIVSPNGFKSQIGRFAPRFNNYNQQDAQEFLRYLLEGLHEDVNRVRTRPARISDSPDNLLSNDQKAAEYWKRYLRFDNSKIVDIFVGQLCSTLRCTVCQHSSLTFDPFWDLSLPLPTRTGTLRLQQCFEHFTKEEVLDGDEKPTCAKCQMRRKCTKSLTIQKFPKILVLHLKRFSPNERYRAKLSVPVTFPLDGLDLSPYAEGRDKNCTYRLYGIANHSGTTYSGHYMAYCKHPASGDWHQYNDTRVSSISTSQLVSSEAYLLFYEQTLGSS